jgi:hypothetical protein
MTTTSSGVRVPVPAVPQKGPVLSLLASSVTPSNALEETYDLNGKQVDALPSDLELELDASEDELWTRGIQYAPENLSAAINRAPNDRTTVMDPFTPANEAIVECDPFAIVTHYTCSPFGFQAIDYKGRAQRQNDLATPAAIELEFWDGAIARAAGAPNLYLTKAGAATILNPTLGTAVTIQNGLSLLQDGLRQGLGGQGMIHCVPGASPSLLNVRRVGKYMLDEFDNIVVPGVGYSGNGPIGAASATPPAGEAWMFATDLVMTRIQPTARVFPDTMSEALDRGQDSNPNTVTFRAERLAMAYFDGFRLFAVLVNLPS